MTVNNWLKRYEESGVEGLRTRPGRGRKSILKTEDLEAVKRRVKESRQRIREARAELEASLGKKFSHSTLKRYLKKNGGRYKRIRKRLKGQPNAEVYQLKKEVLGKFEELAKMGAIDLYYGDESGIDLEPNVPYGWQFSDEEVSMPSAKGKGINCFGLFTRTNESSVAISRQTITGQFVMEHLERFSFSLRKLTVVVLDNARIHGGKLFKERIPVWQTRGLFIFYLPTYSPHLNLAETVWRKLKYEWLRAEDYLSQGDLQYAVKQGLRAFGKSLRINFSDFNYSLK